MYEKCAAHAGFCFSYKSYCFFASSLPSSYYSGCMNSLIGTLRSGNGDASENFVSFRTFLPLYQVTRLLERIGELGWN